MIEIPLNGAPAFFSVEIDLDRRTYELTFLWNERSESWFMDIAILPGGVLVAGVRVVPDYPMLLQYTRPLMPTGSFIFVADGTISRIGRDDLGTACTLVYFEESDVAAL